MTSVLFGSPFYFIKSANKTCLKDIWKPLTTTLITLDGSDKVCDLSEWTFFLSLSRCRQYFTLSNIIIWKGSLVGIYLYRIFAKPEGSLSFTELFFVSFNLLSFSSFFCTPANNIAMVLVHSLFTKHSYRLQRASYFQLK